MIEREETSSTCVPNAAQEACVTTSYARPSLVRANEVFMSGRIILLKSLTRGSKRKRKISDSVL